MDLLLISERDDDRDFAEKVANLAGLTLHEDPEGAKVTAFVQEHKETVIFWSLDHPKAADKLAHNSVHSLTHRLLRAKVPFDRIFAISNEPINTLKYVPNLPVFGHHIIRRYPDVFPGLIAKIARAALSEDPFGLENFIPDPLANKKIVLNESRQRGIVVEALANILRTKMRPNMVENVAQITDELLMNAVYDAPVDKNGFTYRKQGSRTDNFLLKPKEEITLEMAQGDEYFSVSVTDQFGSLEKEIVLGFIRKDYENENYRVQEKVTGAGLGIYGMINGGNSLLFMCKPRVKTEVVLFYPNVTSKRQFRESFQFFGFIMCK